MRTDLTTQGFGADPVWSAPILGTPTSLPAGIYDGGELLPDITSDELTTLIDAGVAHYDGTWRALFPDQPPVFAGGAPIGGDLHVFSLADESEIPQASDPGFQEALKAIHDQTEFFRAVNAKQQRDIAATKAAAAAAAERQRDQLKTVADRQQADARAVIAGRDATANRMIADADEQFARFTAEQLKETWHRQDEAALAKLIKDQQADFAAAMKKANDAFDKNIEDIKKGIAATKAAKLKVTAAKLKLAKAQAAAAKPATGGSGAPSFPSGGGNVIHVIQSAPVRTAAFRGNNWWWWLLLAAYALSRR